MPDSDQGRRAWMVAAAVRYREPTGRCFPPTAEFCPATLGFAGILFPDVRGRSPKPTWSDPTHREVPERDDGALPPARLLSYWTARAAASGPAPFACSDPRLP